MKFLLLFFLLIGSFTFAQKLKLNQKKALFILEFASEFNWPKHASAKTFKIGILGQHPELYEALMANSQHGLIKYKRIQIVCYKTIESLDDPHILYLNGNTDIDVHALFRKINGKEILLVSENLEDFNFSMINFMDDDDDLIFSINKPILKQAGFSPSQNLLDMAILKESEWRSAIEKINEHNLVNANHITLSNQEINELNTTNKQQVNEISAQRKKIEEQLKNIGNQSVKLKTLEENLLLLNEEIQQNIREQELKLENLKNEIKQKQEKINFQNEVIESRGSLIKAQTYLIANQKRALFVASSIILIILILLLLIFRFNRLRKKANLQLILQNEQLSIQKNLIEQNHQQITDSLNYAHLIQTAILPSAEYMQSIFTDFFILNKPRDIVGGDFYWCYQNEDNVYLITADCTGHGVPGGFMSMLGSSLLNEIIIENNITEPAEILNKLRKKIISNLKQNESNLSSKDGMDLVALKINLTNYQLTYANANNPFWIVRKNINTEYAAQKMPVGFYADMRDFVQHTVLLEKNDCIYTFSDGYADQFGGPKGKKFKYKPLQELLTENSDKDFKEQEKIVTQTFLNWQKHHQQVDDVLVIGLKIS